MEIPSENPPDEAIHSTSGEEINRSWYAVYTKARHEKRVHSQLLDKGIESFLPLVKKTRRWKDRKKKVDFPLFTSYVFVRIDYRFRLPVLETYGVVKIVNFRGRPAPIPDHQIEAIKRMLRFPDRIRLEDYIASGDRVVVTAGPLEGITGIIRYVRKDQARLVVSLDSIRQSVSIEIDRDMVRKIESQ